MIGLLQRVTQASVEIEGRCIAAIDRGLLVLVGVQRGDSERESERLLERLLGYRVFPDEAGRTDTHVGGIAPIDHQGTQHTCNNPGQVDKYPFPAQDWLPSHLFVTTYT